MEPTLRQSQRLKHKSEERERIKKVIEALDIEETEKNCISAKWLQSSFSGLGNLNDSNRFCKSTGDISAETAKGKKQRRTQKCGKLPAKRDQEFYSQHRIDVLFRKSVNAVQEGTVNNSQLFRTETVRNLSNIDNECSSTIGDTFVSAEDNLNVFGLQLDESYEDDSNCNLRGDSDISGEDQINNEEDLTINEDNRNYKDKEVINNMASGSDNVDINAQGQKIKTVVPQINMEELQKQDLKTMMLTIATSINDLKTDMMEEIKSIKESKEETKKKIDSMVTAKVNEELMKTKAELRGCQLQINELTSVTIRQEQMIAECKNEIESLQMYVSRKNLLIKGVVVSHNQTCKDAISNFFKEKLKIEEEIPIKKAYRLGKAE